MSDISLFNFPLGGRNHLSPCASCACAPRSALRLQSHHHQALTPLPDALGHIDRSRSRRRCGRVSAQMFRDVCRTLHAACVRAAAYVAHRSMCAWHSASFVVNSSCSRATNRVICTAMRLLLFRTLMGSARTAVNPVAGSSSTR